MPECFFILADEVEGAINPERYRNRLKFFNQVKIKDFAEVVNDLFVPAKRYPNKVFDWLRIDRINEGGFLLEDSIITAQGKEIDKSSVQFAKEGDILIARLGPSLSNEKTLIAPKTKNNLVVSSEFIVLRPKNIDPETIIYIFKTNKYLKYILSKGRGGTPSRLRIDRTDFLELNFPKIDKNISIKISNLVSGLKNKIKSKEVEAQKLLDSINDYVLDELGIKFSPIKEDKNYCINSEELENNRSDPYYFNPKFKRLVVDLQKSKITLVKLKEVAEDIFNGKTPTKEDYAEEGNLILKVSCLKNNKIKWDNLSYFKEGVPAVKTIKDKDVLLLSSAHQGEYLGKNPCIVEMPNNLKDQKIYFVGELISIRANTEKINPYYLLAVLKLHEYYLFINREKRGQTSHLYPEDLGNVIIPLPSFAVQNKIAEEVKRRMQKAEQLQKESKEELEKAKLEVERMILN